LKYQIAHLTRYTSDSKVSIGLNQLCLIPRTTAYQEVLTHQVTTTPTPTIQDLRLDFFGNHLTYLAFEQGYRKLMIRAHCTVEVHSRPDLNGEPRVRVEDVRQSLTRRQGKVDVLTSFCRAPSPYAPMGIPEIQEVAHGILAPDRPILEGLASLLRWFKSEFEFDPAATSIDTPVLEIFKHRRGVCQDFAHLTLSLCRSVGLPARYVSGYLRTHPPAGKPRLRGADASHAWVGVFAGPLGWIDIDPTNHCFVNQDHITIAWGRDYSDVTPVRGVVVGAGSHALEVKVDVEPSEVT
jgi:transglutaminase-like putative cysteine protease